MVLTADHCRYLQAGHSGPTCQAWVSNCMKVMISSVLTYCVQPSHAILIRATKQGCGWSIWASIQRLP